MKDIITITTSAFALSVIAFAAALAVLKRGAWRKPTMTFRDLLRDNAPTSADFLFSSEKERRSGDETT